MKREEQVRRNLELTGDFLAHLLDHPDELDALPDGVHVVLIPSDDPELVTANFELARTLLAGPSNHEGLSRTETRRPAEPIAAEGVYLQPIRP